MYPYDDQGASPFQMMETPAPAAMDPGALSPFAQPPAGNVVDWGSGGQPAAPQGRSWKDKMQNALMLALSLAPIGKMAGSTLGRLALGGGAGAGVALAASPAEAADASSGDPVLDALTSQLKIKQQQYTEEYQGKSGTGVKGSGPATSRIQGEITDLTNKIANRQNEIRNQGLIETPAQKLERERMEQEAKDESQARADKRADDNRTRFFQGAAVGAGAGTLLSGAAAYLTHGKLGRLQDVANDLKALTDGARKSTFAQKGTADDVAALVDEANSLRGQPKPFGENPSRFGTSYSREGAEDTVGGTQQLGPFQQVAPDAHYITPAARYAPPEAKAAADAVVKSREASGPFLGENFDKPYNFGTFTGEMALPALGAADYGITDYLANTTDDKDEAQRYRDLGQLGLGFAVGSKAARSITKPFTPALAKMVNGKPLSTAPVSAAKNKLQREMGEAAASPAASRPPSLNGPPGGSSPSPPTSSVQPVRLPPSQGGGLPVDELQKRAQQSAVQRSAFHADPTNKSMTDTIAAIQGRGARVTADTVMRELRTSLNGSKIDGVPINRRQIGLWLKRHGYLK